MKIVHKLFCVAHTKPFQNNRSFVWWWFFFVCVFFFVFYLFISGTLSFLLIRERSVLNIILPEKRAVREHRHDSPDSLSSSRFLSVYYVFVCQHSKPASCLSYSIHFFNIRPYISSTPGWLFLPIHTIENLLYTLKIRLHRCLSGFFFRTEGKS